MCGGIKFERDGVLRTARSCHCSRCRKALKHQLTHLLSPKTSSDYRVKSFLRHTLVMMDSAFNFCSKCGSTFCGIVNDAIHGVTLDCINGDPKIDLVRHVYVG